VNNPEEWIFCEKCGERNPQNNYACEACGFVLHGTAPAKVHVTDDNSMGGLIPYKNAPALWAYYLGIFAIIPFLGAPLGLAAAITGFIGLGRARENPEVKGKVHAWVGILAGGFFFVLYSSILFVMMNS
jgi:hypothetical protein